MRNKSDKYDEHGRCRTCRSEPEYDETWDCSYCPKCKKWLESKCSDPTCSYCKVRPDRPRAEKREGEDS